MGEGPARRVVVEVGGESLRHMLGEEIRRKGLRCDIADAAPAGPPAPAKRPVEGATRLSVILARSAAGEIRTYPAGENLYDDGLLRTTIVPARIDASAAGAADAAAREAVQAFGGAGVFGVEMTVDAKGAIVVHEVSPGVHNTGHYTIDACRTSQYEQHVRAVSGMELGEPTLLYAAVTVKIYGAPGLQGPYLLEGVDAVRSIPGATVHLYGAKETAPRRVLGHVTLVGVNHPSFRDALVHRADSICRMIVQKESRR